MSQKLKDNKNKVYRLVLTGGPCGGKTTGQARLSNFFEGLGWKVFRVPETISLLTGGGMKASDPDLKDDAWYRMHENHLRLMMRIEDTYFELGASCSENCLIICDGGTMDVSAYVEPDRWQEMMKRNGWNDVDLRDSRYNLVVHMVSVANGGSPDSARHCFKHHRTGLNATAAKAFDDAQLQAWVGHPYYDVIDNSTDFERKIIRMITAVCNRLDIQTGDRLASDSYKRKFLVARLPDPKMFPQFQDFSVVHDYLATPNHKMQARVRRRGQNGNWTYTHTIRQPIRDCTEQKMQISSREYQLLLEQKDSGRYTIYKTRRCFLWMNQYFQMDIYQKPCNKRCKGLILLETYTSDKRPDFPLPNFLDVVREVTEEPEYSMYNLSKKDRPFMPEKKPFAKTDLQEMARSDEISCSTEQENQLGSENMDVRLKSGIKSSPELLTKRDKCSRFFRMNGVNGCTPRIEELHGPKRSAGSESLSGWL